MKTVKLLVDLVIHYMFIKFIIFFLNFRKLQGTKLTPFNKVILSIVMLLYLVSLFSAVFIFGLLIIYIKPEWNNLIYRFLQLISFNVFYIKDSIISLMLAYLYYYKGMQ